MTVRGLYETIVSRLQEAGCDSPAFDARCLLEHFACVPRGAVPLWAEREVPAPACRATIGAAQERAGGRPLQYILGEWDFLSLTLRVGEGVLIPRPDTETLCLAAAARLRGVEHPRVLDLCAGSGCVGLGLCSLLAGAEVTAVELSSAAWPYLTENIARYPRYAVTPVCADVLTGEGPFHGGYDAILSNPPYIPSNELAGLSREVRREPPLALDGGDGYRFYRAIVEVWVPRLAPGGLCAVEVGCGQAEAVAALFREEGLTEVETLPDLAGIDRVVAGLAVG